ncbi:MAG: DUF305 domain-containing protein [Gammaproteobacteria bacterium]
MRMPVKRIHAKLAMHGVGAALWIAASAAVWGQAPIVHPGAPGQPSHLLAADDATRIAEINYSPEDVRFMQDMIWHHHQALEMAALAPERTNNPKLLEVAHRIEATQSDEIRFMQKWLAERGQPAPDPVQHEAMHHTHMMAGMATPEQMAELAASHGTDFFRLFLTLMIHHHDGAVKMVADLLQLPGTAFDPLLFDFTNDITNEQTAEIQKMNALLATLSSDPRVGLAAGYEDAGEAISNLAHLSWLKRPPGFFDPDNPAELPKYHNRHHPLLSFMNTDMAFSGDLLVIGSFHGFNMYRLGKEGVPSLLSSVVCPGGQGDVSIVGNLVIMSVDQLTGRVDCGLQGVSEDVSAERFRGVRVFDISDRMRPVQVAAVQTCRGSHNNTVATGPGKDGRIIVFSSGTMVVRSEKELSGCVTGAPGDDHTSLYRIDVIEIPVNAPEKARLVGSPAVLADPNKGMAAGLWRGGDHGPGTQETSPTEHCHDITTFPERHIAAGACSGNGVLFDITDPLRPKRIDAAVDTHFSYWHSAAFNNDGTKVLFTDTWGSGTRPRCRAWDPLDWGANAIFDIVDGKLEFRSYFKMPAAQSEQENCVGHNGSLIPVPGRDIFVQAWHQGGVSVFDFTDSAHPVEIAFFDRGPINAEHLVLGGYWSAYWYAGRIYASEIFRGLDTFRLLPSKFLSENEIAAAALAQQGGRSNPQQQFPVTWPAEPVVARAYIDQLERDGAFPAEREGTLRRAGPCYRTPVERRARFETGESAQRVRADTDEIRQ